MPGGEAGEGGARAGGQGVDAAHLDQGRQELSERGKQDAAGGDETGHGGSALTGEDGRPVRPETGDDEDEGGAADVGGPVEHGLEREAVVDHREEVGEAQRAGAEHEEPQGGPAKAGVREDAEHERAEELADGEQDLETGLGLGRGDDEPGALDAEDQQEPGDREQRDDADDEHGSPAQCLRRDLWTARALELSKASIKRDDDDRDSSGVRGEARVVP